MPSRRLGSPMVAIAVLITVSVLFVIAIAEGFKVVNDETGDDRGENEAGFWWKRKDTQNGVPLGALWSRAFSSQHDVQPQTFQLSNMVGAISDAAGKLVDSGVSDAMGVAAKANSATPANAAGTVPGMMAEVDNAINPGTEGVAQIVNAATGAVGSLLASASGVSNIGVLADSIASVTSAGGGDVQEATSILGSVIASATSLAGSAHSGASSTAESALASSSSSAAASMAGFPPAYPEGDNWQGSMTSSSSGLGNNSVSMLANATSSSAKNMTVSMAISTSAAKNMSVSASAQNSISSIMATVQMPQPQNMSSMVAQSSLKPTMPSMPQNYTLPRPMNSSCLATVTSVCPAPVTETCTVTETWFSTQYSATVTMYSFMDVLTITCTETISDCMMELPAMTMPSNGSYMQMPAADSQHSSLPKYANIDGTHSSKSNSLPQPGASAQSSKASVTIQHSTESATPSSLAKLITDENLVFCADGSMAGDTSMCPDGGAQSPSLIMAKVRPQKLPREDNKKTETITAILDATSTHNAFASAKSRDEKNIFSMNAMRGGSFKKSKKDMNGDGQNGKESTK